MNEPMITGRQPDSGNPTVRDERGACGNVGYGRGYTGTYSGNAETAKSGPKVARAVFLPDSLSLLRKLDSLNDMILSRSSRTECNALHQRDVGRELLKMNGVFCQTLLIVAGEP